MNAPFDLNQHDVLFASRAAPDEWARIKEFRSRPGFLTAARFHEGVMMPFFEYRLILSRVVAEIWRFQMIVFTLYLHETRDLADPRSGLTLANLQRVCTQLGIASPGRVYAFLNLMRVGGFLSTKRSVQDNRVVHFIPTAQFMDTVESWNANIFRALDAAAPDARYSELSQKWPELGREMRTSGGEGLLNGWVPLDPFPEVMHFASAEGGWMMMEHIVAQSVVGDPPNAIQPAALDLRDCANRFGGSRTNLQRLLDAAFERGLLDEKPRGGNPVRFSSLMVCAFLSFLASYLSNYETHTKIALTRILNRA